jgi:hypothetical protein
MPSKQSARQKAEDGRNTFLPNVGELLPNYMVT